MKDQNEQKQHSGLIAALLLATAATCVIAASTGLWVLTAIPIGLWFGFFLEKGDLCGASALSEVLLMKDRRKVWGLWVAIATSMAAFALLDVLGLVQLSPKPLTWANIVIGGILFGSGMVLAGGCVSGTLFKAGAGHLNSIVALIAIPIGVGLVEHGPLAGFSAALKSHVLANTDGGPVTISSLTGLPFPWLALLIAVATLAAACIIGKRKTDSERNSFSFTAVLTARSWKPWQAGILIGLLGGGAYLSSAISGRNYPLGVTHGVYHAQLLLTDHDLNHVYQNKASVVPAPPQQPAPAPARKKVSWWLVALVTSLVAGSWISARLSGKARLTSKPPEQVLVSAVGGLLVGVGAAIAGGCVIGNTLSGVALMSVGAVLFTIVVLLSNWTTTWLYLMGGEMPFQRQGE